ncbi:hypothetical protein [Streptomyces canus]|uniref:hypothetical protein n=1 Tax=Streptomyces canus TaxID=58343 RepID=UPI002E2759DC
MEPHTDHLAKAAAGLRLLDDPDRHPWPIVAQAAAEVPRHVYRALLALKAYDELTPVDQVAMCSALAEGHVIGDHARSAPTARLYARLDHLADECAHFGAECDPSMSWRFDPKRGTQLDRAVDHLTVYAALDPVWQAQVIDRLTPPRELSTRLMRALRYVAPPTPQPRPALDEVLTEAVEHMGRDEVQGTATATATAQDLVGRLSRMPQEWQLHVMRRLDLGATPLDAISSAAMARNLVHHRLGLDGWQAPTAALPPTS